MDQVWPNRAEAQKVAANITQKDGIPVIVLPVREDTPATSNAPTPAVAPTTAKTVDVPSIPDLFVPSILQKKAPKAFTEIPTISSNASPAPIVQTAKSNILAANTLSTYAVVVTTVASETKAQQWVQLLQKQGIDARIISSANNQTAAYTVQLNQEWIRESDATKMADKISQSYAITPQVVMQNVRY
jgi:cell division septation protein DedD